MIAKIFNFIFGYNSKLENTLILSRDKEKIVLPNFPVEKPKLILDEIRYNVKNLFDDKNLKYLELISFSFTEMQNKYLINYLQENKDLYSYNEDEDLCIMSGFVMSENYKTNLHWVAIPQQIEFKTKENQQSLDTLDLLIDHVIKNMVL